MQDSCYILYAQVSGTSARVKQGIVVKSGKVNFPDRMKCSDIPSLEPTLELVAAARSILASCQDAQNGGTVHAPQLLWWRVSLVVCPGPVFPVR